MRIPKCIACCLSWCYKSDEKEKLSDEEEEEAQPPVELDSTKNDAKKAEREQKAKEEAARVHKLLNDETPHIPPLSPTSSVEDPTHQEPPSVAPVDTTESEQAGAQEGVPLSDAEEEEDGGENGRPDDLGNSTVWVEENVPAS